MERANAWARDYTDKCEALELRLKIYEGYDEARVRMEKELKEKEKLVMTGTAAANILTNLMMKELTKMDYTSCELVNSGGYGVIFKIISPTKGTNILKLDFKNELCIKNEIRVFDRLNKSCKEES